MVHDSHQLREYSLDSQPIKGIIVLFPTLEGNHISSDEEEDSDPYIGVAFGYTY